MKKKILLTGCVIGLFLLAIFFTRLVLTPKGSFETESPLWDLRVLTLSVAEYRIIYNTFPPDLRSLGGYQEGVAPSANAAGRISDKLASGSAVGYRFTYHPSSSKAKGPLDRFTLNADPIDGCSTFPVNYLSDEHGVLQKDCNHYFVDEHGVIHVEANSSATAASPQIRYDR